MIYAIIYILGLILAIKAVIEVFKEPISIVGKIITSLIVLLFSWFGIAIYYIFMRGKLQKWFK